ncbi:(2Fe-2S)-binding protein [Herbidospora cretacea]|uniref:(2Fe-2S)-binding protein n=1 Tax=Herbidospora cretacea TaxID=28444 RepID=UPI0009EE5D7F|nr:(2Fe-2S)-binding protein [Herbidospora cretacea]
METIRTALEEVAEFGTFFALTIGGGAAGWHDVRADYATGFADLVERTATRYGTTEMRIGASIAQLSHAARLWSPVLATALTHGIVPDLTRIDRADDGPRLRLPTPEGHPYKNPEQLFDQVVRRHLEPLAAGLRVKIASRLLYGNAASALAEAGRAIVAARPDLAEAATELVDHLLAFPELAGKGVLISPKLAFRRTTCCLYYRVPNGEKCGDCALAGR